MKVFLKAIDKHRFSFLSLPGVVSVGMGIKRTGKTSTGIPALVFGVKKKVAARDLPADQIVPRKLDGLPTDVVEVGRIRFHGYALPGPQKPPGNQPDTRTVRMRPAQPGVSVAHYKVTAGTLGAVVRGNFPGGAAILSNNHILANATSGSDGRSRVGDPVLQPGPYDGGGPRDVIAGLHSFSPMVPDNGSREGYLNKIDAAIAIPVQPNLVKDTILGLGPVKGTAAAYPGMAILKSGRSSGVTRGSVKTIGNTIRVENEDSTYIFEDQVGTAAISEDGDSGSLIVDRNGRAVGLLFAGSDKATFFNPIASIVDYFKITI